MQDKIEFKPTYFRDQPHKKKKKKKTYLHH